MEIQRRSFDEMCADIQSNMDAGLESNFNLGGILLEAHAEADINYGNYRDAKGKPCRNPKQAMKVFFDSYCEPLGLSGKTIRQYGQVAEKLTVDQVKLIGGMTNAAIISMDKVSDEMREDYLNQAANGTTWTKEKLRESVKLRLEPSYEEMKAKAKEEKEAYEAKQEALKEKYGDVNQVAQDAIDLCEDDEEKLARLAAIIQNKLDDIRGVNAAMEEYDREEEQAALLGDFAHYEHEDTTCAHPFDTLELSADASWAEARKAYKKLASKYHPDKHVDKTERAQKVAAGKFRRVQHAMDLLEAYYKGK